jgi:hypothetical protein
MKLGKVAAFAAVGALVLGACNSGTSSGGKGTINFGIELPQQGSELAASQAIINGIKLAVKGLATDRRLDGRHPELGRPRRRQGRRP